MPNVEIVYSTMAADVDCGTSLVTFSVNVNKLEGENKYPVVKNTIWRIDKTSTWFDLFDYATNTLTEDDLPQDAWDNFEKVASVSVSASLQGGQFNVDPYEKIHVLSDFDPTLKYVTINLKLETPTESDVNNNTEHKNALAVLMAARTATKMAKPLDVNRPRFTEKDKLYNDLCTHMADEGVSFPAAMGEESISTHMTTIVNTLWYLDGNKDTLTERAKHSKDVKPLPNRFLQNYNGYNDWKKKKRKAPSLDSTELKKHSGLLFRLISFSFTQHWGEFKSDLEKMALSLSSYAEYLKQSLDMQQKRQALSHPTRQVGDSCTLSHRPAINPVSPRYVILDSVVSSREPYQYLMFDEASHVDSYFKDYSAKYYYFQKLELSVPVDMLQYSPGGSGGSIVLLWRTPEQRDNNEALNMSVKVAEAVKPLLPEYHTRYMKNQFLKKFSNLPVKLTPAVLRVIYSELTLDASADQNPALEERIRQAIMSEDMELVTDLRHLNKGRPNDSFEVFFQGLSQKVEEIAAADERRHQVEHLSEFISVKDLIQQVKANLPENTPIPSESTVLFSFVPKNAHRKAAKLYKSKVPLQFKIQSRQLRSSHQDDHYCAALFKYIRQYAVKFKKLVPFLCVDDKAKVDFGEPGAANSTGVRGKKSIVPITSTLAALDHDLQTKGSITPSVCLKIDIPDTIENSFYKGKVTVTYKDSVFQPSTPFRHGIEIQIILENGDGDVPPVLIIYSDGGPDHRITYHSVKLALIVLFKILDLDLLIAGRTAPGHSWLNPSERIMSVLNLAFQNVALMRDECTVEMEMTLKGANSMAEIRGKADRVRGLKQAWIQAVQPIIETLESRTNRLSLKGEQFTCKDAATDEDVTAFEQQLQQVVDGTITLGQYQEKHLKSKSDYKQFLADHCRERQYVFQIRKCSTPTCCSPRRADVDFPWVPDPQLQPSNPSHYEIFEKVLFKDTTEKDRPSSMNSKPSAVAEQMQGIRNAGLVAQNVRAIATCYECMKPRCIYSTRKLSTRELRSIGRVMEKYDYSCGSVIVPEGHVLEGVISVKLQMDCATHVEFAYYADKNVVPVKRDTCCHCAEVGAERDRDLMKSYMIVLPVCQRCLRMGKPVPKRNPVK